MDDNRKQQELIQKLAELVNELGWVIGLPDNEEMVSGLIVGTEDFVREVVESYYGPSYSVFKEDPTGNESIERQEDSLEIIKKKPTLH